MKEFMVAALLFICYKTEAQSQSEPNTKVGFEVDLLPYFTGGYYGSVWIGHNHVRYRAIVTRLTTPEFYVENGFTNNRIQAYTLIADYFLKPNFEKWWVGSGFEYWKESIQTDAKTSTAYFNNTIFTLGGGYALKFFKNFYLNPWAAFHLRIAGASEVWVSSEEYRVPELTPEISLKIGWHF